MSKIINMFKSLFTKEKENKIKELDMFKFVMEAQELKRSNIVSDKEYEELMELVFKAKIR